MLTRRVVCLFCPALRSFHIKNFTQVDPSGLRLTLEKPSQAPILHPLMEASHSETHHEICQRLNTIELILSTQARVVA